MNLTYALDIKPINPGVTRHNTQQSTYDVAAKLPCRSILFGPSGSGGATLLCYLILNIYDDSFSRSCIFNPSINVDSIWIPVNEYIEHGMKINP